MNRILLISAVDKSVIYHCLLNTGFKSEFVFLN